MGWRANHVKFGCPTSAAVSVVKINHGASRKLGIVRGS